MISQSHKVSVFALALTASCYAEEEQPPDYQASYDADGTGSVRGIASKSGAPAISESEVRSALRDEGVFAWFDQFSATYAYSPSVLSDTLGVVTRLTGEEAMTSASLGGRGETASFHFNEAPSSDGLYIKHKRDSFADHLGSSTSSAEIKERAIRDFGKLQLGQFSDLEVHASKLMAEDSDASEAPRELAHKVWITPRLGKETVVGPRVIFSYFLDGELHKAHIRWPEAIADESLGQPVSEDEITQTVQEQLQAHPLGTRPIAELEASGILVVRNGRIRRAVLLRGKLVDGEGVPGRWGLLEIVTESS